jgi:RNA polymerase sigma-70 factor, ECF subfamily
VRRDIASDDELLLAAAADDREAFSILVDRHRGWVRSIMLAYVRDRDQAEDLTQDAFCRVYQNRASYTAQGTFVAWLKQISINLARDYLRARKRTPVEPLDEEHEAAALTIEFDPMAALASSLLSQDLRASIQQLPDDQRLTLVMHYFGSISIQDIAWAMKCPIGTVRSRLFNGLRRVRQTLTAQWNREGEGDL